MLPALIQVQIAVYHVGDDYYNQDLKYDNYVQDYRILSIHRVRYFFTEGLMIMLANKWMCLIYVKTDDCVSVRESAEFLAREMATKKLMIILHYSNVTKKMLYKISI